MKQYEIWVADLPMHKKSHVQFGYRPVVIVSNDACNTCSSVVTVVPLTARRSKHQMPTHVFLEGQGLDRGSIALCEQVMPLDKSRLKSRIGSVYKRFDRLALCHGLAVQLGLASFLDVVV